MNTSPTILNQLTSRNTSQRRKAAQEIATLSSGCNLLGIPGELKSVIIWSLKNQVERATISTASETKQFTAEQIAPFLVGDTLKIGTAEMKIRVIDFADSDLINDKIA